MSQEFRYKPPLKYLFFGLTIPFFGIIFLMMISLKEPWVSLFLLILGLLFLLAGGGLLLIYINKFSVGNLILTDKYIMILGRWKKRQTVMFTDINEIGEFNTYDEVIEIATADGVHLIEKQ